MHWGECDNCGRFALLRAGRCSSGDTAQCAKCGREDELHRLITEGEIPEHLESYVQVLDSLPAVLRSVPTEQVANIHARLGALIVRVTNLEAQRLRLDRLPLITDGPATPVRR